MLQAQWTPTKETRTQDMQFKAIPLRLVILNLWIPPQISTEPYSLPVSRVTSYL